MDISSLLSPGDLARSNSLTPADVSSEQEAFRRTSSGPTKSSVAASPLSQSMLPGSSIPSHLLSPREVSRTTSSPLNSPRAQATMTPPIGSAPISRNDSTPSMDALADLASMQSHQPARSTPPVLRSRESYESQLSPSSIFPNVPAVSVTSNPRPSLDLTRMDSSRVYTRTDYSDSSLPLEIRQQASSLSKTLQDRPSAFVSHTQLINILHQGFVEHVYPSDSPDAHGDPKSYDLLRDLRAARENMHKLFAMGEDLWMDWLRDETMLARTNDEKISVTNRCLDAVAEEYGSIKLWKMYGDWMLHCYNSARPQSQPESDTLVEEEERLLGQETFTWDLVMDTWQQAAESVRWRLSDSHIICDQYLNLLVKNASDGIEADAVKAKQEFESRLCTLHSTWDDTFQAFSSFISNSPFRQHYEEIMVETAKAANSAKLHWANREALESALKAVQNSGSSDAEYAAFANYIQWELTPDKRRRPDFNLTNAIYQRAELRFPSDATVWEDHILWLVDKCPAAQKSHFLMSTLERATRHCPWSGSLWSQYLLTSEKERYPHSEIEGIKHKATSTGLLDVGGIEEVLKVHAAWCGYLRRRAFRFGAGDEELDVAEVGIRSSIELVQQLASELGHNQVIDPQFRLERLYINFLSDSQSWDSAKEAFQGWSKTFGTSYEFWLRFYDWEMMRWRKFVVGHQANSQPGKHPTPQFATAVLRDALKHELDQPEPIMRKLIAHCEDYEDVDELQEAVIEVKKAEKLVASQKQAELHGVQAVQTNGVEPHTSKDSVLGSKRKYEQIGDEEIVAKRPRNEEEMVPKDEEAEPMAPPKRDREHATILVQNLPIGVTVTRLRQFFRDCGTINTVKLLKDRDDTALIEFEDQPSATFALTRSGRELDGSTLDIQLEKQSTLFVTNYPPSMGEDGLRGVFTKYGEVMEIRLPSLQGNAGRRFCYVQFRRRADAQSALELDGFESEPGLQLSVKISEPSKKHERSGPAEDGRQLFIRNLAFKVSEKYLQKEFSKFGVVESVKIPQDDKGRSKGFGFLTFIEVQAAEAALEMNGEKLKDREINVSIARKPGSKHQAVLRGARSTSPTANGDAKSPSAMSVASGGDRERRSENTIALANVPDTVSVSRIRALAEEHGVVTKVSLQPAHQGAIIEYAVPLAAGKAAMALESYEISSGRPVHVVTVREMLKHEAEKKLDKIQVGKKAAHVQPNQVKRPSQYASKRGGGLGQKKGLGFVKSQQADAVNGDGGAIKKNNDDFRAILQNSSERKD